MGKGTVSPHSPDYFRRDWFPYSGLRRGCREAVGSPLDWGPKYAEFFCGVSRFGVEGLDHPNTRKGLGFGV